MPVYCQFCGELLDEQGFRVELDACAECRQEKEEMADQIAETFDDDTDDEQLHEWPAKDIYDYYDDGADYDFDIDLWEWSADYEKELWLNGTVMNPRDEDYTREDGKPLWWSEEIDEDPSVRYGEPPIQWDPWV